MVHAVRQLLRVRRSAPENLRADVRIPPLCGPAARLARSQPLTKPVFACRSRLPFQIPKSHALLAMKIRAGAYQLIPHAGVNNVALTRHNSRDLKLAGNDRRPAVQIRSEEHTSELQSPV